MNEAAATLRRRWFRYSLRTLFVVMTLACVWLGWQNSIVQTRWRLLEQLKQQTGTSTIAYDVANRSYSGYFLDQAIDERIAKYGPGAFRRWLGDQAYYRITMPQTVDWSGLDDSPSPEVVQKIRGQIRQQLHAAGDPYQKAFPEAKIVIAESSEAFLLLEELDALFAKYPEYPEW